MMALQVGVDFSSSDGALVLRATGSSVKEPGYLAVSAVVHRLQVAHKQLCVPEPTPYQFFIYLGA